MAITALSRVTIDGVSYNTVKFDDINFGELGYVVQASPSYEFAETEVENIKLPGRNGDVIHATGAYLNSTKTYILAKKINESDDFRDHTDYISQARQIVAKLKSKIGYKILQDSYESDVYRYGAFKDAGVVVNKYDQAIAIQLNFDCKPQRYYISGETEFHPTLINRLHCDESCYIGSSPIIKINRNLKNNVYAEYTNLAINGYDHATQTIHSLYYLSMRINWPLNSTHIIIDTDRMDCYDENGNNMNEAVEYSEKFPKFDDSLYFHIRTSNSNGDYINVADVEYVKPRWWTL